MFEPPWVYAMRRASATARQVGQRLNQASAAEWLAELTGVLDRVTLDTGRIRVQLSRNGLFAKLGVPAGSLVDRDEF